MEPSDVMAINRHYAPADLNGTLRTALNEIGGDLSLIRGEGLRAFDELHLGGRPATLHMGRLAALKPHDHVLDAGCGLGGPARTLAAYFGCRVTGIDLVEPFCRAAHIITRQAGIDARVNFHRANALELPFVDGTFDVVWHQHFSMNILEKDRLYREQHRVLRDQGRLVLHEVIAGRHHPPRYPVPWARGAEISFLSAEAEMKTILSNAGFEIRYWQDGSSSARQWFSRVLERNKRYRPGPLHQGIVFGPDLRRMSQNMRENLLEERIRVVECVLIKKNQYKPSQKRDLGSRSPLKSGGAGTADMNFKQDGAAVSAKTAQP